MSFQSQCLNLVGNGPLCEVMQLVRGLGEASLFSFSVDHKLPQVIAVTNIPSSPIGGELADFLFRIRQYRIFACIITYFVRFLKFSMNRCLIKHVALNESTSQS